MAFRKNDGLRNAQADALGNLFNGGKLELRTGAQPADPDTAATGTLLAEIELPADAFGVSADGVITKLGTWNGVALATATVGWGRFYSADVAKTFDVSVAESGADLIIDEEDMVEDTVVSVVAFQISVVN